MKKKAVIGLIKLFNSKFHHSPVWHTLGVYMSLVKHIFSDSVAVRKEVLTCLLSINASSSLHATLNDKQSPFLVCLPWGQQLAKPLPKGTAQLPLHDLFNGLFYLLQHETSLEVSLKFENELKHPNFFFAEFRFDCFIFSEIVGRKNFVSMHGFESFLFLNL